ncbi:DUF2726 domain-containing protein [Paracoccus litorisediminis]|uniref:DUF2726 domain-containing protein n=1 Tax=Paracoccus litorisediminis TaxID=2006130 RepID=UPI0037341927
MKTLEIPMDPIGTTFTFGTLSILWLFNRWLVARRQAVRSGKPGGDAAMAPELRKTAKRGGERKQGKEGGKSDVTGKPSGKAARRPGIVARVVAALGQLFRRQPAEDPDHGLYSAQPLLNKEERVLFVELERQIRSIFGSGYWLMCQVSLGEILKSKDHGAFWKINNKRADFVLMSPSYMPLATIEYQGSGHWGFTEEHAEKAEKSDALKRKALRSAGISMIEVFENWNPRSLRKQLVSLKKRKT